jgi:hypothetical protein
MKLNTTIRAGASGTSQWPSNKEPCSPDQNVTRIEKHGTGPVETGEGDDHGKE